MKAKIKRNYLGTFLILISENRKEKDELLGLWQKIPDITFAKRVLYLEIYLLECIVL